jgi:hypothetical protein
MTPTRTRLALALATVLASAWATRTAALPSYYGTECQACHQAPNPSTTPTCAGCHSHGTHSSSAKSDINLAGTFAQGKTSYAPGETVTVTVTGGYQAGWARLVLLDDGMQEIARSSCGTGSGPPQPCATSQLPGATLSHAAPAAAGAHTWAIAWYGNKRDASGASFGSGTTAVLAPGAWRDDPNNANHGWQVVALAPFTVTAAAADAGTGGGADAGTGGTDGGTTDAGTGGTDAGTGTGETDAGAGGTDAGTSGTDAGTSTGAPTTGGSSGSSSGGCSTGGGSLAAAGLILLGALAARRRRARRAR